MENVFTPEGETRAHYLEFCEDLEKKPQLKKMQSFCSTRQIPNSGAPMGMTFNVYHDNQGLGKDLSTRYHSAHNSELKNGENWRLDEAANECRLKHVSLQIIIMSAAFKKRNIPSDLS